jgi:cell pole-organizing protein PopZ
MEDILASIRRILSEDEAPAAAAQPPSAQPAHDDILVLDTAMIVPEPAPHEAAPESEPPPQPPPAAARLPSLVEPEAAAATATSVGSLVRTLMERSTQVRSGGPTIEDIVREEIRPLLKEWLNANLPLLVERLVRAEIERVVGRAVP